MNLIDTTILLQEKGIQPESITGQELARLIICGGNMHVDGMKKWFISSMGFFHSLIQKSPNEKDRHISYIKNGRKLYETILPFLTDSSKLSL